MNGDVDRRSVFWGSVFVVLGVVFMLQRLDVWSISGEIVWPLLLIAVGVGVMLRSGSRPSR